MAMSEVILLRKVVHNLARDINNATISRAMGKIDLQIDTRTIKHNSGFYRGSYPNDKWYFMMSPSLAPHMFPERWKNDKFWEKIRLEDEKELAEYLARQTILTTGSSDKKIKEPDEVDLINVIITHK